MDDYADTSETAAVETVETVETGFLLRNPVSRSYRPYPAYKDSGVEWLGEVPGHWEVRTLRRILQRRRVKNGYAERPMLSLSAYRGIVLKDYDDEALIRPTEENSEYVVVKPGQLVVNPMWVINSSIGVSTVSGIVSPAYRVYDVSPDMFGSFLHNLSKSLPYISQYNRYIRGLTTYDRSVREDDFLNIEALIPPLPEQRAIAAFLDRKTADIDALIAAKERLIALLREKRAALITQAVTKGLDPDVAMKDSGVEWLGEVPGHWEVKRLKFLLVEPLKYGANEVAELVNSDHPRYIRITDITEDGGLREDTFRSLPPEVAEPFLLEDGDVLFARSGATVGKVFRYDVSWGIAAYAGYLIRARLDGSDLESKFLELFTQTTVYWDWLRSSFIQSTIQNVSAERYANLLIPMPPLPEQRAIAAFLERETAEIDALVSKVEAAIERLREYRTALISAAVTGKIDVREAY